MLIYELNLDLIRYLLLHDLFLSYLRYPVLSDVDALVLLHTYYGISVHFMHGRNRHFFSHLLYISDIFIQLLLD